MITEIPTPTDYENTGLSLLNLAWENTLSLAVSLDEAQEYSEGDVSENEYWNACQTQLSTSVSLVQQATEFLLKSRIASVSPYLLISGTPRDWPKGCNNNDTPFAEFYAIDAQDLVRTNDTVSTVRLPDNMKMLFEEMRKLRNSIMHTVDKRLKLEVKQVVVAILEISNWFWGTNKWISTRRERIENSPNSIAYSEYSDAATFILAREVIKAIEILLPAESKRLLGFDKKQRSYICYECVSDCPDCDLRPNLALLVPNTPTSTTLHCYLCEKDHKVIRKNCDNKDCKGNVLDAVEECCLTCYH